MKTLVDSSRAATTSTYSRLAPGDYRGHEKVSLFSSWGEKCQEKKSWLSRPGDEAGCPTPSPGFGEGVGSCRSAAYEFAPAARRWTSISTGPSTPSAHARKLLHSSPPGAALVPVEPGSALTTPTWRRKPRVTCKRGTCQRSPQEIPEQSRGRGGLHG